MGTLLLVLGVVVFCLYLVDINHGLPFYPPDFWARNLSLWPFVGVIFSFTGIFILRSLSRVSQPDWKPSVPGQRFTSLIVYTREQCHLCDEAKNLLLAYRKWLPEAIEVDVDTDPELVDAYGESVPVIAFDGEVRFQGVINETLLQRLIEGTSPVPNQLPVISN